MNTKTLIESKLIRLAAFIGALAFVINKTFNAFIKAADLTPEVYKLILVGFNLLVLVVFILNSTKVNKLTFFKKTDDYKLMYCEVFRIKKETILAEFNESRVNKLIIQLNNNILLYCFFLILVYIIYLIDFDKQNPWSTYFHIAADLCNYLSSVFIYLAFKVLHDKTLDNFNNRTVYYADAVIFSLIYLVIYILFSTNSEILTSKDPEFYKTLLNLLGLFSGLANGLAMTLLFGKYRSLEHSIGRIDKIKPINFIYLGTVFILPIYTLVQPLFGSFEIRAFGNPDIFKNVVFFICLIGKTFFLYFTYTFIKEKLLHLHIHMLLTSKEIPPTADLCFNIFDNSDS